MTQRRRGELEEEQVGDLFDVVPVSDPRVLEDVGVVPDFGDDGGGILRHYILSDLCSRSYLSPRHRSVPSRDGSIIDVVKII